MGGAVLGPRRTLALLGGTPAFSEPVYITRPRLPPRAAFDALVDDIYQTRWLTNDGPLVRRLEAQLRGRLGTAFCSTFCNGTLALLAALRSLDLHGEVITTPFTFPATVHAIEWAGLTPVFCDVDPATYNLDVTRAVELISPHTAAVLPVHVFGNPCDVVAMDAVARAHGLRVVYDAAHAFGVVHRGRPIGCWGDLSIFSFHATKLFHTAEGGAVAGPDDRLLSGLAAMRNFGIRSEEVVRGVGLNGKLSELQAAMGLAMLELVDDEIQRRGELTARYRAHLSKVDGVTFQHVAPETVPTHAYFTIEVDAERFGVSRDTLHRALRAENIITRKYFAPLCSDNEAYRHLDSAQPQYLPNARRLASRILCLPLYGELSVAQVDQIVECLLAVRDSAAAVQAAAEAPRP